MRLLKGFFWLMCSLPMTALAMEITITPVSQDAWRLRYNITTATHKLHFSRPGDFRRDTWKPEQGFVWEDQVLVREDGKAFDSVMLDMDVDTRKRQADYQVFRQFSDGSLAMYTGHLFAYPDGADSPAVTTLTFVGDHWLVPGSKDTEDVAITVDEFSGMYAYQGEIQPFTSPFATLLLDPAMPAWSVDQLQTVAPQLLQHYATVFGAELPTTPLILFTFDQASDGTSSEGGTLSSHVQMGLIGKGWLQKSDGLRDRLNYLIAHEFVHLWNGGLYHHSQEVGTAWLHEGSAEFWAWKALRNLNLISEQTYVDTFSALMGKCLRATQEKSMHAAMAENYGLSYPCGAALHLNVDLNLADKADLHWRQIFQATKNGRYDVVDWFSKANQLSSDRVGYEAYITLHMRSGLDSRLQQRLTQGGATVGYAATTDSTYQSQLRIELLKDLLGRDCGGGYSIYSESDHFVLAGLPQCQSLKNDERIVVTHVAGAALFGEIDKAWDNINRNCASGETFTIGSNKSEMQWPCSEPFQKPEPPLVIQSLPEKQ